MKIFFKLFSSFLFFCSIISAQQKQLDSLNHILKVSKNDTEKVKTIITIAETYAFSNPDTMELICNRALDAIKQSGSHNDEETRRLTSLKSATLNDIGFSEYMSGRNANALRFYNMALETAMQVGDSISIAGILTNRGIIYRRQGKLPMALDDYLRASKIAEAAGDQSTLSVIVNNLGRVYTDIGDTQNAMAYLWKSCSIAEKNGDQYALEYSLANLGTLNYSYGKYQSALYYYNAALKVNRKTGNRDQYAHILDQLGSSYFTAGDRKKAIETFQESVSIFDSLHSKTGLAATLENLGQAQYNIGNYDEAEKTTLRAFDISREINSKENIDNAAFLLYQIYSKKDEKLKALGMLETHMQMRDTLHNDQSRKALFKKQYQYEYEKKAAVAKVEQEKEALTHRITTISISIGLFLVIIFSAFLLNRFRLIKKQKALIEVQKIIVDTKNKEMLDSIHYAKRIQDSLLPTEKYIDRNFKRLRN